jgi:hypothetical protein
VLYGTCLSLVGNRAGGNSGAASVAMRTASAGEGRGFMRAFMS